MSVDAGHDPIAVVSDLPRQRAAPTAVAHDPTPVGPGAGAPVPPTPPVRRGWVTAVVRLVVGLLPPCRAKNVLLGLGRGSSVARSARVAPVILWKVGTVRLGEHTSLGPGSVFRDLRLLHLDDGARVGQFNWFSGAAQNMRQADESLRAALAMGENSAITNRHYVDCSGGLRLGVATLIAGVRSTILTHSLDPRDWRQGAAPVVVGDSSVLYTNVVVTAGRTVARDSLVAAGAVVTRDLTVPGRMYGGVPAAAIADTSGAAYVGRTTTRDVDSQAAYLLAATIRRRRALSVLARG